MRVAENSQGRLNSVDELVRITEAEVEVSLVKARSETEPTGGWGVSSGTMPEGGRQRRFRCRCLPLKR